MHLLRFEQPLHLIGYRIVGIIAEVWGDVVGSSEDGRTCPTRDVKYLLVGGLLGHLNRIDSTH